MSKEEEETKIVEDSKEVVEDKMSLIQVSILQIQEQDSKEEENSKEEEDSKEYGFKYKVTGSSSLYGFDDAIIPIRSDQVVSSNRECLDETSISGLANGKLSVSLVSLSETEEENKEEKILGETWISLHTLISSGGEMSRNLGIDRFRFQISICLDKETKEYCERGSMCTISKVTLCGKLPFKESSQKFNISSFVENEKDYVLEGGEMIGEDRVIFSNNLVSFISNKSLEMIGSSPDSRFVSWPWSVSCSNNDGEILLVSGKSDALDVVEPGKTHIEMRGQAEWKDDDDDASTTVTMTCHVNFSRAVVKSLDEFWSKRSSFKDLIAEEKLKSKIPPLDAAKYFETQVRYAVRQVLLTTQDVMSEQDENKESLVRNVMYALNTNGTYASFRDRLRGAVARLVREKCSNGGIKDVQNKTFLASVYEDCTRRCNCVVREMIDEVRSGYRKKDNTEKEPLESYLVRSRVLAQEAEMNGDLSKARSLHFARVKRVDEEYVLDIEEIKQKQKTLQETIRECVRFCFRAKHTSEKETQELLKRSCALNFKDVFALKAYGCSLLSHERFDDAAAVFHHLEEVVSAIEESDDVVHDDDNEIKEQDAVALMCVLWTRASWYGTFRHPKWQSVARGGAQNQAEALLRVAKSLSEYRMFELCEFVLNMARDVASQMSSDFTSRLSLESALCALRKGDFQYCLEMSCEALETSKENPSRQRIVYSVLGHANYSLNRHDNALTCYELSLNDQSNDVGLCELYPHISNSTTFDPFVYLNLGKLYLERKRFEDAKEVYLRICTCFPCSSVWMRVGEVCHSLGENPDAERALVEANLLDNTNILVWLQISLTCLQGKRKNRIESAWSSYTSALDLMTNDNNTSFSHILTKIATRLFELREFEKCRKICTFIVSSTKLNQNDISRARFCLGKILEAKGLYKDAVKTYNELLGSSSSGGGGGSSSSSSTVPGDVAEEARRRVIRLNELAWS